MIQKPRPPRAPSEQPQAPPKPSKATELGAKLGDKVKQFQEKMASEQVPELFNRPDLQNRSMAALIDVMAAVLVFFFFAFAGRMILPAGIGTVVEAAVSAVCGLFLLFKDGVRGQSPGKRLVHIRVVRTDRDAPVDVVTSAMRNWPLAMMFAGPFVSSALGFLPFNTILAMLLMLGAFVLACYEVYQVLMDREAGRHLGDSMARTRVTDD
jgi:uncharacterized RDD family membrane protein YckC